MSSWRLNLPGWWSWRFLVCLYIYLDKLEITTGIKICKQLRKNYHSLFESDLNKFGFRTLFFYMFIKYKVVAGLFGPVLAVPGWGLAVSPRPGGVCLLPPLLPAFLPWHCILPRQRLHQRTKYTGTGTCFIIYVLSYFFCAFLKTIFCAFVSV